MKKGLHLPIYFTLISITFLTFSFISCDKNSGSGDGAGEPVLVTVNIDANSNYEDGGDIGNNNDQEAKTMASIGLPIESHTIELNDKFLLKAELIPTGQFSPSSSRKIKASTSQNASADLKADIVRNPLSPNVRYKLVVFKANGDYLQEVDYVYTQEASAAKLMLDGTVSYIFVAYSVNSTSVLPAITFSNPANKTLSTASVVAPAGNMDLMYFRRDLTLPQNTPTNLNVVLKHKLTQITTKIDASQTGYVIDNLSNVTLSGHLPNATLSLASGNVSQSGTSSTVPLTFSGLNTMVMTAAPVLLNADPAGTTLSIESMRITHITSPNNIQPIVLAKVAPGFKYNMVLTIVPNDGYLTHSGKSAVRIGGQIWMRWNLGAPGESNSLDPDKIPVTSSQHGDFYQWGRKVAFANGTYVPPTAPSNWDGKRFTMTNAWNSGTATAPVKTINDPCPSGFRVPTIAEYNTLIQNVIITGTGTWSDTMRDFTSAKVLTSKRKSSVKMTLPAQGFYNVSGRAEGNEFNYVYGISAINYGTYWTSNFRSSPPTYDEIGLLVFQGQNGNTRFEAIYKAPNNANSVLGQNIRCIAGN